MVRIVKWTDKETNILYKYGHDLSCQKLQEMIPRHTVKGVDVRCRRLGIMRSKECKVRNGKESNPFRLDQSFTLEDLNNVEYQVLIGSMLGDGSITRNKNRSYYYFAEGHAIEQRDYVLWKSKMLSSFSPKFYDYKFPTIRTCGHTIFKKLRILLYENEKYKHIIPNEFISRLDHLGFLVWFLDDGNFDYSTKARNINCGAWTRSSLLLLVDSINKKFGLTISLKSECKTRNGKPYSFLYINAKSRNKILPIWKSIYKQYNLPKCIEYKLL